MNMINEWWENLDFALQLFYGIGIVSTLILLVQTFLMLLGLDHSDMDLDTDFDLDAGDSGMHILSVRTVIAFATGFGWTGVICLKAGLAMWLSLLIAVVVGSVLMFSIFALMRFFYSMRQDGSVNYHNAIGEVGTVYLPIPPGGQKPGRIEVMVQGRLAVVEAFCKGDEKLENQSKVKVVDTVGERGLLVEPLD